MSFMIAAALAANAGIGLFSALKNKPKSSNYPKPPKPTPAPQFPEEKILGRGAEQARRMGKLSWQRVLSEAARSGLQSGSTLERLRSNQATQMGQQAYGNQREVAIAKASYIMKEHARMQKAKEDYWQQTATREQSLEAGKMAHRTGIANVGSNLVNNLMLASMMKTNTPSATTGPYVPTSGATDSLEGWKMPYEQPANYSSWQGGGEYSRYMFDPYGGSNS